MYRIAFIGGGGVGKSTLAHSFSSYAEKQGLRAAVANLDPGCRHLAYKPAFDIRKHYKAWDVMKKMRLGPHGALKKIYALAAKNRGLLAEINSAEADFLFLDTAGSLELFMLENQAGFLRGVADAVVFVCDDESVSSPEDFAVLKAVNAIQELKYALPTLTAVNKCELLKKGFGKGKTGKDAGSAGGFAAVGEHLSSLLKEIGRSQKLFFVSAKKKLGFKELFDALNELKCECGEH